MNEAPLLYITGPGRCGTSLLTRYCQRLGFSVGSDWGWISPDVDTFTIGQHRTGWDNLTDSGLEDVRVRQANKLWLMRGEAQNLFDVINNYPHRIVKDCYLFRHPSLLGIWLGERPNMKVIYLWRDPMAMAESWERKAKLEGDAGRPLRPKRMAKEHLAKNLARSLVVWNQVIRHRRLPAFRLDYPRFLDQFLQVNTALRWAGLEINSLSSIQTWRTLIDPGKNHCGG